jgi:hypothetical protein
MRAEFVFGDAEGRWWPGLPSATAVSPTLCWSRGAGVVTALEICLDSYFGERASVPVLHPLSKVVAAASLLFEAAHEILVRFEGQQLVAHWRHDLVPVERYAKGALLSHMALAEMKAVQGSATAGRPLTICDGKRYRRVRPPHWFAGVPTRSSSHGDGCGVVFPDSCRRASKIYCDRCSADDSNRQRTMEAEARAYAAGRRKVLVDETPVWEGRCACCGGYFTNARPDTARCEECRRGGRRRR